MGPDNPCRAIDAFECVGCRYQNSENIEKSGDLFRSADLLVALMGPLIFAGSLSLMEVIAETIFFVAHCITAKSCSVLNVFADSAVSRPGFEPEARD